MHDRSCSGGWEVQRVGAAEATRQTPSHAGVRVAQGGSRGSPADHWLWLSGFLRHTGCAYPCFRHLWGGCSQNSLPHTPSTQAQPRRCGLGIPRWELSGYSLTRSPSNSGNTHFKHPHFHREGHWGTERLNAFSLSWMTTEGSIRSRTDYPVYSLCFKLLCSNKIHRVIGHAYCSMSFLKLCS